jgi:hypothetical protein
MDIEFLMREMAENPKRIKALVAGVTKTEARYKPSPKSWSILEVVNHLYDEERFDFRVRLDIILHKPQDNWPPITPTAWVRQHKYNTRDLQASLDDYLRERRRSLRWLRSLGKVDWNTRYSRKGRSMRAGDMFAAWVAHDGLHIRQLNELHRSLLERAAKPYRVGYAGEW